MWLEQLDITIFEVDKCHLYRNRSELQPNCQKCAPVPTLTYTMIWMLKLHKIEN